MPGSSRWEQRSYGRPGFYGGLPRTFGLEVPVLISKLVALLIAPLGTAMVVMVVGLLAGLRGHARLATLSLAMVMGWLWLWSMPVLTDSLRGWIENQAGPRELATLPSAGAIVLLGGGVRGAHPPERPDPDLSNSADRVWYAARLFHSGKAPVIIACGGVVIPGTTSEASAMRQVLLDFGVPDSSLILEEGSRNTAENARIAGQLLKRKGISEFLLVTSALHMRRARALFDEIGLKAISAPTDFQTIDQPLSVDRFFPDARALEASGYVMKELLGILVGR